MRAPATRKERRPIVGSLTAGTSRSLVEEDCSLCWDGMSAISVNLDRVPVGGRPGGRPEVCHYHSGVDMEPKTKAVTSDWKTVAETSWWMLWSWHQLAAMVLAMQPKHLFWNDGCCPIVCHPKENLPKCISPTGFFFFAQPSAPPTALAVWAAGAVFSYTDNFVVAAVVFCCCFF